MLVTHLWELALKRFLIQKHSCKYQAQLGTVLHNNKQYTPTDDGPYANHNMYLQCKCNSLRKRIQHIPDYIIVPSSTWLPLCFSDVPPYLPFSFQNWSWLLLLITFQVWPFTLNYGMCTGVCTQSISFNLDAHGKKWTLVLKVLKLSKFTDSWSQNYTQSIMHHSTISPAQQISARRLFYV